MDRPLVHTGLDLFQILQVDMVLSATAAIRQQQDGMRMAQCIKKPQQQEMLVLLVITQTDTDWRLMQVVRLVYMIQTIQARCFQRTKKCITLSNFSILLNNHK